MRRRLRLLFLALMGTGVAWIFLMNYVRLGRTPASYPLRVNLVLLGGAVLTGLLLDTLAGRHLRPFFAAVARLQRGGAPQPGDTDVVSRAIRFPERAALLLLGVSILLTGLHRAVSYRGHLLEILRSPELSTNLYSSVARDLMLTLLLALLLFTLSRRVLREGVEIFGLREPPNQRRFPVGLRLAMLVLLTGLFNVALLLSAPETIPGHRLLWIYVPPALLTAVVTYLVATDIGADLEAIAARLRILARGVRPSLYHRFAVTERDEVGELVASINVLQDRVEQELREFERDMEAARSIQQGMLPRILRLPEGWQVAARLHPARDVGGDFYDLIDLGNGKYGIALGDAASKGLPAALLTASAVSLLRSHAHLHDDPGAVLGAVNRLLCTSVPPMAFVTAIYAVVDTAKREIRMASAGHLPPFLAHKELLPLPALPLGVDAETTYAQQVLPLAPGEPLLLYSDGLIEGGSRPAEEAWTWLADVLRKPHSDPDRLLDLLMAPLRSRVEQAKLQDDVTLLVLIPPPAELVFELPSQDGAELDAARRAIRFAQDHGLAHVADDIGTAVCEACLNAIAHGNRFDATLPVRVRLTAGSGWLEATVSDAGSLFVPPAGPPDLAAQMRSNEPIGGWGWHLIRSMADLVEIEPLQSGKQLRMRFGGDAHV